MKSHRLLFRIRRLAGGTFFGIIGSMSIFLSITRLSPSFFLTGLLFVAFSSHFLRNELCTFGRKKVWAIRISELTQLNLRVDIDPSVAITRGRIRFELDFSTGLYNGTVQLHEDQRVIGTKVLPVIKEEHPLFLDLGINRRELLNRRDNVFWLDFVLNEPKSKIFIEIKLSSNIVRLKKLFTPSGDIKIDMSICLYENDFIWRECKADLIRLLQRLNLKGDKQQSSMDVN